MNIGCGDGDTDESCFGYIYCRKQKIAGQIQRVILADCLAVSQQHCINENKNRTLTGRHQRGYVSKCQQIESECDEWKMAL